jgi:Na+/H+ antiporter NhaA
MTQVVQLHIPERRKEKRETSTSVCYITITNILSYAVLPFLAVSNTILITNRLYVIQWQEDEE